MRPKKRAYKDARYDRLRRLCCCTVCGCQDERTRAGGALCVRCLLEKRGNQDEKGQTKLCL